MVGSDYYISEWFQHSFSSGSRKRSRSGSFKRSLSASTKIDTLWEENQRDESNRRLWDSKIWERRKAEKMAEQMRRKSMTKSQQVEERRLQLAMEEEERMRKIQKRAEVNAKRKTIDELKTGLAKMVAEHVDRNPLRESKRRRVGSSSSSKQTQRGTLATLPVELFILVCLALDSPKDVLALASTCKAARAKFLENNVILRHVRPSFNPEPTLFIRSSTSPRVELSLWTAAILERKFPENSAFDNCTHCSSTSRTFPKQPSIMPWPLSTVGNFTKCRLSFNKQLLHSWVSQHFDLPAQKGVYTSSNDPTNSKFMQEVNYSRTPTRKLSNIENRRIINVVGFALNLLTKLFRFVSVTTPTGTPRYESIVDYTKLFNLTLKDSIWIAVVLRMSLSSEKQQAGLTAGQFQMCDCGKQLKGEFFGLFGKEFLDAISLVVDIRLAALYRTDFLSNRTQLMSGNSTIIPEGLRHVFWDENQEYLKSRMTIIESILDSPGGSSYEFGRLTSRLKLQNNGELPAGFVKDLNTCVRKEMPIVDLEFKAVRVSKDGFVNMEKGLGEDDVSPDGKWALFRVSDLWALKAKVYQLTRPPVS